MPRFLVQVEPQRVREASIGLASLAGVALTGRPVFDYLIVDAAAEGPLRQIAGVINVAPDSPVGIFQNEVRPVDQELVAWARAIVTPFGLPSALAFSQARSQVWSTAQSRLSVGADAADADGITGRGVRVAVLDTGADPGAIQRPGIIGESTVDGEPHPLDQNGHSTHVYTTIAGSRFSHPVHGLIQGVAAGVDLIVIKVLGYVIGTGSMSGILMGMQLAADRGAKIINMSLGGPDTADPNAPEHRAVSQLADRGVICVIAAGNSGPDPQTIGSPGSAPDALTLGAIDPQGQVAGFSSRGTTLLGRTKPDCVAPGVNILSESTGLIAAMRVADGPWKFAAISGTSMATPHAAAVLALAEEYANRRGRSLTTSEVKEALVRTGGAPNNSTGSGVITYPLLKSYIDGRV